MFDWSTEQNIVAGVGAFLLLALMLAMLLTQAGLTMRRIAGLAVIGCVFAVLVWTMGGALIERDRDATFIASCASAQEQVAASVDRLDPGGAAVVLFFRAGDPPCNPDWHTKAGILPKPRQLDPDAGLDGLVGVANPLAEAIWARTLVFLYDPAVPTWNSDVLPLLGQAESGHDLFFANVNETGEAYALNFEITGKVQPVPFNGIINPVALRLSGGLATDRTEVKLDLCFSLDRAVSWHACGSNENVLLLNHVTLTQAAPGVASWSWTPPSTKALADLIFDPGHACVPAACDTGFAKTRLLPGWHTLHIRARFADNSAPVTDGGIAPANVTFNVGASGATVIIGTTEPLATRGWPAPIAPASDGIARNLLAAAAANTSGGSTSLQRLQNFPMAPATLASGAETCVLKTNASAALLQACLDVSRAVLLVEPEADFLRTFAAKAPDLVRRGVAITVAGVPEIATSDVAGAEAWLPAWPPAGTAVRVAARQVLVLADCSGLAQMPAVSGAEEMLNPAAPRPYSEQQAVMMQLGALLKSVPDMIAADVTANGDVIRLEHGQRWLPPLTVGLVPGCLRDSTNKIASTRELIETADLAQRLVAFLPGPSQTVAAPFPAFEADGTLYPGSAIVIFSTRAAQIGGLAVMGRRSGAAVGTGGLASDWAPVPSDDAVWQALQRAGIKVVLVELPTNPAFEEIAAALATDPSQHWGNAVADLKARFDNIVTLQHTGNPEKTAQMILDELGAVAAPPPIHREHYGRTADPRTPVDVAAAPLAVRPLVLPPTVPAARPLQTLDGALIAAERNDLGAPIVALSYSPFDIAAWVSDIASASAVSDDFSALCPSPCPLDAWLAAFTNRVTLGRDAHSHSTALGIQRYLDLAAQTSTLAAPTAELTLDAVQIAVSGDYLTARFHLPQRGERGASWTDPTLDLPAAATHCGSRARGNRCPLVLRALEPLDGTVTYLFATAAGLPSAPIAPSGGTSPPAPAYALYTSDAPTARPTAHLPLWLDARQQISIDTSKVVAAMRQIGAVPAGAALPRAFGSALPTASLILTVLVLILFSPLVRPWHALSLLWRRRRAVLPEAVFDAALVSALAGARPATYEASRRAGDPAWIRRMQAGDSLSRAIIADLANLTPIRRRTGGLMQIPRVRLREIGESFDVVIAVDDAPAMLLPGDLGLATV